MTVVANPLVRWTLLLFLLPACVGQTPLENLPCPCANGWICCDGQDICVREGVSCSSLILSVSPASPQVRFGGTLALSASQPVRWSLEEGEAAGSIGSDGMYHAPLSRGPFHVLATSLARPNQSVRVEVPVGPSRLELHAGHIGGYGFADGVAAEARFGRLGEVVGDGQKTLFLLDTGNQAIRKIDTVTRQVTTLARLARSDGKVTHLTYDSQSGLFAILESNDKLSTGVDWILAIDPTTGAVRQSNAVPHSEIYSTSSRVRGLAVLGDFLYEIDQRRMFRRPIVGGTWQVAAGSRTGGIDDGMGEAARFGSLQAVFTDGHGRLRLLDCLESKPIWVSDPPDNCAGRAYDPQTSAVTTMRLYKGLSDGAFLHGYRRMAIDKDYEFMVWGQWVQKGDLTVGLGNWSNDSYYPVMSNTDAIWAQTSQVYIADTENGVVRRLGPLPYGNASSSTTLTTLAGTRIYSGAIDGASTDARFAAPRVLSADAQGGLFLQGLRYIDAQGQVSSLGGWGMSGLVVEKGRWIFTNSEYNAVITYDPQTGKGGIVAGDYMRHTGNRDGVGFDAAFNQPAALASDMAGSFYIADRGNGAVRRLVLASATVSTLASGFDAPFAVAVGDGEVFVAEQKAVRRVRIDSGTVTTLSGAADGWKQISALVYDPAGILYVSDIDDSRVRAIVVASGQIFDVVGHSGVAGVRLGPLPAAVNTPNGLALLPSGELAVSSAAENSILIAR